jgi:hypothetical protein
MPIALLTNIFTSPNRRAVKKLQAGLMIGFGLRYGDFQAFDRKEQVQ